MKCFQDMTCSCTHILTAVVDAYTGPPLDQVSQNYSMGMERTFNALRLAETIRTTDDCYT